MAGNPPLMASPRLIINDLRAQALALDGRHRQGVMLDPVCHSLRRGADELERLLAELQLLRAYADIPEEVE